MTATDTDLNALLERVRSATGPDRELDCHLWVLMQGGDARMHYTDPASQDFVWERGIDGFWVRDVVKFRAIRRFTTSIDASVAFKERVLPGWGSGILSWSAGGKYPVMRMERSHPTNLEVAEEGETRPLAILAACISGLIKERAQP